jgi:hypothetical protein
MTPEQPFNEMGPSPQEKARDLFEKKDIKGLHELVKTEFNNYFEHVNYEQRPSAPLISSEDESVLFTGASISAIKPILISGNYPEGKNGVYLSQECLRTRALTHAFENDYIPFGQTYFNMSTILSKPGRFKEVTQEALDFTINCLGIDASRILIRSTKENSELNAIDTYVGVKVDFDKQKSSYYHWNYGIPGVHGEGVAICIFNPADNKYWDVGNIVRIVDENNRELGTEFGYGYEFLLTAMVGVEEPLEMSQIFELYKLEEGLPKKYYSYMEAVVRMKRAGTEIGDHEERHIYKQYLKSLQFMGQTLGKSVEDVITEMKGFSYFLDENSLDLQKEETLMNKHLDRKAQVRQMVKRVGKFLWAREHDQKAKEAIQDPWAMIDNYLTQNGIDRLEVEKELERLNRFKKEAD